MKYKSRDANEKEIVEALRARGCKVHRLDGDPGVPDLLVEVPDPVMMDLYDWLARTVPQLRIPDRLREGIQDRHVRWVLLEVKNPDAKPPGDALTVKQLEHEYTAVKDKCDAHTARWLKVSQAEFLLHHSAPMAVVTSVAEALAVVGLGQEVT